MKLGLSLAGGGIKGMAHIGAITVLEEEGIPIDYISGTSSGSIIASLYASRIYYFWNVWYFQKVC